MRTRRTPSNVLTRSVAKKMGITVELPPLMTLKKPGKQSTSREKIVVTSHPEGNLPPNVSETRVLPSDPQMMNSPRVMLHRMTEADVLVAQTNVEDIPPSSNQTAEPSVLQNCLMPCEEEIAMETDVVPSDSQMESLTGVDEPAAPEMSFLPCVDQIQILPDQEMEITPSFDEVHADPNANQLPSCGEPMIVTDPSTSEEAIVSDAEKSSMLHAEGTMVASDLEVTSSPTANESTAPLDTDMNLSPGSDQNMVPPDSQVWSSPSLGINMLSGDSETHLPNVGEVEEPSDVQMNLPCVMLHRMTEVEILNAQGTLKVPVA